MSYFLLFVSLLQNSLLNNALYPSKCPFLTSLFPSKKKKRWKIINSKICRHIFLCLTLEFLKCPLICNTCRSVFIKGYVTAKKILSAKSKLQNIVIFMGNKFFMVLVEIFTKSGIIGYFTSPQNLTWRHILWYLRSSKFWGRDNFLDFETCLKRWI